MTNSEMKKQVIEMFLENVPELEGIEIANDTMLISSGYVDSFTQWSLDPSRQPGDTGIIQNTGSSVKGYHIMYFAGWDDPVWAVSAKNALNNEQYSQWAEKLASACTVTRGSGLKYVE